MNDTEDPDDPLIPYVLGELAPDEALAFERRLASDPALAAEAKQLREAFGMVGLSAIAAPPPRLRTRVLAAARAEHTRSRVVRRWVPMAAAAAVILVAISLPLMDAARTRRQLMVEREAHDLLVQPNLVQSFTMKGVGASRAAFGEVLLDLDDKRAAIALRGLPAPPTGSVYRLWAEVGVRSIYCGGLDPDETSAVKSLLPIPVESYKGSVTRLYVTLDPQDSPLKPVGPTVLSSS